MGGKHVFRVRAGWGTIRAPTSIRDVCDAMYRIQYTSYTSVLDILFIVIMCTSYGCDSS